MSEVPKPTGRWLQILQLLAIGESPKRIAVELHLSEFTVRGYLHDIYEELDAKGQAHAVAIAFRLKWIA